MMHDEDWRHRAVCGDEDSELFFPVSEVGPGARQVRQAKAVCARCPVRAECLKHALETGDVDSVSGGMSPDERKPLLRRAEPSAVGERAPAVESAFPSARRSMSQQAVARRATRSAYNTTRRRPTVSVSR